MAFKHYDPKALIPELVKRGVTSSSDTICPGCVFTGVSPEYCFHSRFDMRETSVQSDGMCAHCADTIEEYRKPFHLYKDKELEDKLKELDAILEMAEDSQ